MTGWSGAAGIREGLSEEAARRLKPEGSSGSGHTQIYWAACRAKALGQERAVSSSGGSQSMSWGTLGGASQGQNSHKDDDGIFLLHSSQEDAEELSGVHASMTD